MTRDDVIKIAQDAGITFVTDFGVASATPEWLERFADAIIEECAKVCERISDEYQELEGRRYPELKTDAETGASECAGDIRALKSKAPDHT